LIRAIDGHAKNFRVALKPGGRFVMTLLYHVLPALPSLNAEQLQTKDMRPTMRAGNSRYKGA
jgi:serine/threonine-protein kinase HipA